MKRIAFLIIASFLIGRPQAYALPDQESSVEHRDNISDVFMAIPDSLLPLLTERTRHHLVDFYQSHIEAKMRNRLGEYVRLDTLAADYLHLTLSASSEVAMKLLSTQTDTLVCMIQTVNASVTDSRVKFFTKKWQSVGNIKFPNPRTSEFFPVVPDSSQTAMQQVQRSIDDLRFVQVTVDPAEPVFTLTLGIKMLDVDERKLAIRHLQALRYRWNGREFVDEK